MHLCALTICILSFHGAKKRASDPLKVELWMVLGTKPGPSGRVTSVLNIWAVCLALSFTSFWDNSFADKKKYSQVLHIMHSHMTAPSQIFLCCPVSLWYWGDSYQDHIDEIDEGLCTEEITTLGIFPFISSGFSFRVRPWIQNTVLWLCLASL